MNPYAQPSRLPFLRRNIARAIARGSSYRRRKLSSARTGAATTSAPATLARAVSQYRYSNPMYIQPSNARTASFWRTVSTSIVIQEAGGFAATSPSLNWGFSLGNVYGWLGGAFVYAIPVPNATEFSALFDTYKINAVRMKMFFTNNNSSVNSPNTGLPLIHVANDFDDVTEFMTVSSICERAGVRHLQFDAVNHTGLNHWVKPVPKDLTVSTDPATGAVTTTTNGIPYTGKWLDTANSQIVHNGIKVVYNSQGRTPAGTDIGSITFIFEIEFTMKGYR